jgi:hypothetical protein
MILEIYFNSGDVYIELLISEYYGGENLDNIRMTGLYDTAQFLPGFEYTPGEVFYVTEEDFETPFNINQGGESEDEFCYSLQGGPFWHFLRNFCESLRPSSLQGKFPPKPEYRTF